MSHFGLTKKFVLYTHKWVYGELLYSLFNLDLIFSKNMKNGYSIESSRRETVENAIKKGHLYRHVGVGYTPSDQQIFSHLTSLIGAGPHLTNGVDNNF
jgi:hypothetical protein